MNVVTDPGSDVEKVGTIDIDLKAIDLKDFPCKRKPNPRHPYKGEKWYKVSYDLAIVAEDDLGYMHFKVLVSGEQVGEVKLAIAEHTSN